MPHKPGDLPLGSHRRALGRQLGLLKGGGRRAAGSLLVAGGKAVAETEEETPAAFGQGSGLYCNLPIPPGKVKEGLNTGVKHEDLQTRGIIAPSRAPGLDSLGTGGGHSGF